MTTTGIESVINRSHQRILETASLQMASAIETGGIAKENEEETEIETDFLLACTLDPHLR